LDELRGTKTCAAATIVTGLPLFGIVFAINSSVHTYLILSFLDLDKVTLNVGIYYMAMLQGAWLVASCRVSPASYGG
jgi:hypothetical protein